MSKEIKIRNIDSLNVLNNGRKDYSKISGNLHLPNLVEIQTKSYEEFKLKGLDEQQGNFYMMNRKLMIEKVGYSFLLVAFA